MASSIIGGLVKAGHPASRICAADPHPPSLAKLEEIAAVRTFATNTEAVAGANIIILAVKPQVMADATDSIAAAVQDSGAVVMSIAAGVTVGAMAARLGDAAAIVRCMPNTPALVGCGASGLYANSNVTQQQRGYAEQITAAVGITRWVDDEADLDTITALSGSGPAYFFLLMEAMVDAACEMGLDREAATQLATQTGLGAAQMARDSDVDLAELRRRVTSPGGTTERAIASFEDDGLRAVVTRAMRAAADRAAQMSREMG
tara:strand:+ start:89620 stop:90402 length:783 start_codon:yes stop_codon:yes gene_type:complete